MNITIKCLQCGHGMDLDQTYEHYQGDIRCWVCRGIMEVAFCDGKLAAMRRKPPAQISLVVPEGACSSEVVVVAVPGNEHTEPSS